MTIRKRRSDRSGRGRLLSPGRPPVAGRDERRRFWAAIAAGMASEVAAIGAGAPQAVGTRWFRKAGGMPPAMFARSAKPLSGRYLSFAEREEIALLRAQGTTMQEVARQLGRRDLQRPAHGVDDLLDGLLNRFADLARVDADGFRNAGHEVAALHFHLALVADRIGAERIGQGALSSVYSLTYYGAVAGELGGGRAFRPMMNHPVVSAVAANLGRSECTDRDPQEHTDA